jgi:putative oxidoreductase
LPDQDNRLDPRIVKGAVVVITKSTDERVAVSTQDIGALVLRVATGVVFAAHGAQHLFGWFGGPGLDGFAGLLESLGYESGRLFALIAGLSELAGALLLVLGLLTPLGVAAAVGMMINAIVALHLRLGFWQTAGDLAVLLGLAAVAIAFIGPGTYSLDRRRGWVHGGMRPALAGIGLGALVAAAALLVKII